MKKKILIYIGLVMVCVSLSACGNNNNGDENKGEDENYIEGYEYVKTIDCEALKKEIKFMKDGIIITKDNAVYAYNVDQKYSNGTNCSKFDDTVKIMFIKDGKVYEKNKQVNFDPINLSMTKSNNTLTDRYLEFMKAAGYYMYMRGPTKEGYSSTTYAIKDNSNVIYSFEMGFGRKKENSFYRYYYKVEKNKIDYSVPEDEIIVDFLYNVKEEDFAKDFIRTNKSYYRKRVTNLEESEKYVDVKREYEWYKDEVISKIIDKLAYISDTELITKDGKVYHKQIIE